MSIFYTMFVSSVWLKIFFDHYKLLSTVIYHLWWPYATIYYIVFSIDGYILLTAAIYYFRRPYTTSDGYILLLTVPYYF